MDNPRERIRTAMGHRQPDRLPVDFGSTPTSGIHASIVYKLRQHYGLDDLGTPVKVIEPFQMLGEIKDDLREAIGIDIVLLDGKGTFFGYKKEDWKEWKLGDGTPLLVPGLFNTLENEDGSIYQYAEGDKNYPPSGKMPAKGFFCDSIIRQKPIQEDKLDPKDNLEEFSLLDDKDIVFLKDRMTELRKNNNYAVMGSVASSGFGDIAIVPGPMLKDPKGIRDIEEWYISTFTRKDYIKKVFSGQLDIALENYRKVNDAMGDMIDAVFASATDFGTQLGLFISKDAYREMFKPYHKKINSWIHENTPWKTYMHSCGGIYELIPDIIEAGFDLLNPIQISAQGLDPKKLKKEYGKDIVFWGGGVDTQKIFAMGSPQEVKEQVRQMIETFSPGGGFVFSTVHNVQANVPIENVVAMIEVIQDYR